jgi:hypothetical protein
LNDKSPAEAGLSSPYTDPLKEVIGMWKIKISFSRTGILIEVEPP